jgi:hypothetical protein
MTNVDDSAFSEMFDDLRILPTQPETIVRRMLGRMGGFEVQTNNGLFHQSVRMRCRFGCLRAIGLLFLLAQTSRNMKVSHVGAIS